VSRPTAFLRSLLDPGTYLHGLRLLHYWNYAHVAQRRKLKLGPGVELSPNVSLRNGERIEIGARSHIGEHCALWAGDNSGRIVIGADALFGPQVYITTANYRFDEGAPVMKQERSERDVMIGDDVWLGARVTILPGVTIGAGSIIAAGAVVTADIPAGSVAAGIPARVIKQRFPEIALTPVR
jgi:acetyltransferase-like isoleucine patch superfamily enzyme